MGVVQEDATSNATCDAGKRFLFLPEEKTVKNNLPGNVSQVSVQEQAVVAAQDSSYQKAERTNMPAGPNTEVASSVSTKGKGEEREAMPAPDRDDSAASVQMEDEKGEVKDGKEKPEPPQFGFEYTFVPNFMKGESLLEHLKTRPAPTVEVVEKAAVTREFVISSN